VKLDRIASGKAVKPGRRRVALVLVSLLIGAGAVGYGAFLALRSPAAPARTRSTSGDGAAPSSAGAERIVFVRSAPVVETSLYQKESADIYVMNAEGAGMRRLTSADPYMSNDQPTWSPDGTEIAFVNRWNARGGSIAVMRADGTQVRQLTKSLDDCCPAWSPDGTRVVFVGGYLGLFVITADGTGLRSLFRPRDGQLAAFPVWFADGKRILFRMGSKAGEHLYEIRADGGGLRRLGSYDASFVPALSPDGTRIAFARNDEIFVMGIEGAGLRRVTRCVQPSCVEDEFPAWSPDGHEIAFSRSEGQTKHIYVVNTDGTGLHRLTIGRVWDVEPTWQPLPG
jgi:Tol biopolymer transport system component